MLYDQHDIVGVPGYLCLRPVQRHRQRFVAFLSSPGRTCGYGRNPKLSRIRLGWVWLGWCATTAHDWVGGWVVGRSVGVVVVGSTDDEIDTTDFDRVAGLDPIAIGRKLIRLF